VRDNPEVGELGTFDAIARQARLGSAAAHRPWPLPSAPWSQAETRLDVLLAHWRVPPERLARLLPPGLAADTFDGAAWLGISAFRVTVFRLRGLPPLPGVASFPRLEVSTPVTIGSRPGVWLFQLETGNRLVAEALKRTHRLPAYAARLTLHATAAGFAVDASRDGHGFAARYSPSGRPFVAEPGTLDHFLAERYALYTEDGGRLYRIEVNHPPWRLERARAEFCRTDLAPVPPAGEPSLLYSAAQDVLVWPLEEA
jgi:uncharacterized protein YqjF (DUF2071 family)